MHDKQFCQKCKKPVRHRTKCVSCTLPSGPKTAPPNNSGSKAPNLDYLYVLKAIGQVRMYKYFSMGKKLLIDFLKGNASNKSIQRNSLHLVKYFGSLATKDNEVEQMVDSLILNGLVAQRPIERNSFSKVLELTGRGQIEISQPTLYKKKLSFNFKEVETQITPEDKKNFQKFDRFLSTFNQEQKKAILSENNHILCVAGAGSGKTTVLTKRIEFLVSKRSVDPKKILAITFTRKARKEMSTRLSRVDGLGQVSIETFNSFSEKNLRKHGDLFYGREVRVISYGDKIAIVNRILKNLARTMDDAVQSYFTPSQMRGKTPEQLSYIFINDCFFIRDHFKSIGKTITKSSFFSENVLNTESTQLVFNVCREIEEYMQEHGIRDFTDQLVDAVSLFKAHKDLIPTFEHILVDEYQDVNSAQTELLGLLSPPNLFCVGDPRQSIFGWRGSDLGHILDFEEKYKTCEIVTLTKNYRSTKPIVDLMNSSIKNMGIADIESQIEGKNSLCLRELENEKKEFEFVIKTMREKHPTQSVFVLARTNKQLNELSEELELSNIKHGVRSDERKAKPDIRDSRITLATIHAIKGMEADVVFVIGCSNQNFPCKASEHPIIDMVKSDEYDKEEEERRLFYVALSRARTQLYLTHISVKPTHFITESMLRIIELDNSAPVLPKSKNPISASSQMPPISQEVSQDLTTSLKQWRFSMSKKRSVPAYVVLTNRALEELVQKRPCSLEELKNIHGLGPAKISKYGKEILQLLNNSPRKEKTQITDATKDLLKKLNKLRSELAAIYRCTPNTIFPDSYLSELAKHRPTNKEEMSRVPGLDDPSSLEKYAEPFMHAISDYGNGGC